MGSGANESFIFIKRCIEEKIGEMLVPVGAAATVPHLAGLRILVLCGNFAIGLRLSSLCRENGVA
jgi:hypothetical protein